MFSQELALDKTDRHRPLQAVAATKNQHSGISDKTMAINDGLFVAGVAARISGKMGESVLNLGASLALMFILSIMGASDISAQAESADTLTAAQDSSAVDAEATLGPPVATVELYAAKCASCHTVGGGVRVGPDLKDAHTRRDRDWLTRMIGDPNSMLGTDPDARALLAEFNGVKMPDLGLSDEDIQSLIDLIEKCSLEACDLRGKFTPVTDATDDDVRRGADLFLGILLQESGGPACIACHTVVGASTSAPGGILAKDLTNVFARLGDEGLDASIRNPAFLLMNKIFSEKPLTTDEAFALRAYLYQANRGALANYGQTKDSFSVPLAGAIGAAIALLLLNAVWSRRLRGARELILNGRGTDG